MPIRPADWWRALVVFNYMTGWRISEPLSMLRKDLDLDAGTAIPRAVLISSNLTASQLRLAAKVTGVSLNGNDMSSWDFST